MKRKDVVDKDDEFQREASKTIGELVTLLFMHAATAVTALLVRLLRKASRRKQKKADAQEGEEEENKTKVKEEEEGNANISGVLEPRPIK